MLPTLPDELELLQQLIAGDAESFRKIYEYYQGKIFLFALRLTKSAEGARIFYPEKNYLYPIPQSAIDKNKNLDQNPNY
jgi:hypothetical protein